MTAKLERPLRGIVAAPFLPMLPDERIDWACFDAYYDGIAAAAPTAIAVNMDASEGPSLAREEQLEVLRRTLAVVDGRCPVISGLFAAYTSDAARWAEALAHAGAQGLAVFPPFPVFLGNPIPTEMIVRYHKAIADAGHLPLVAFQFPKAFGPDYPPEALAALAEIPEIVGLKEASFDTAKTVETIAANRRLPRPIGLLTGSDTFIMEAMVMGCDGALIGFAGTATDRLVAMHNAVDTGDWGTAKAIWADLGPLARFCWRPPIRDYRPRMKEVLVMQGLFRHATCRAPQLGVGTVEREELRRLAHGAGLLGGARSIASAAE
jgi:4-hydroxy-tetrahydrodipicolinate synthase